MRKQIRRQIKPVFYKINNAAAHIYNDPETYDPF